MSSVEVQNMPALLLWWDQEAGRHHAPKPQMQRLQTIQTLNKVLVLTIKLHPT